MKIDNILKRYDIKSSDLQYYGDDVAKLKPNTNFKDLKNDKSNLILVTAINPTPRGEGKTTCAIALADALNRIKRKAILCLRQPSIGPTLGFKGGATGNGWSEVIPADVINYGLTGDFFYVETINNLIASIIDNSIYYGNPYHIDLNKIVFKRCIDVSDRSLRHIVATINPKLDLKYTTGFNMTS
ncbi:MAG: formate--tetrahydrofolate ligase, partial [Malacoplasma sp.]|nr:formate--tetrahydrofolate ligase [Malacoplasma sp.]